MGATAATSPSRAGSRQWPVSTAGDWARWPTARPGCSWLTSAPGAGPGGQTAVSAGELGLGQRPVRRGRGAGGETELPVEDRVGLGDAGAGHGARPPQGQVGCWGTPSGCRRPSGTGWRRWGCTTCWTSPAAPRCGRWSRLGPVRSIRDSGVPAPRLRDQRRTMEQRSDELPGDACNGGRGKPGSPQLPVQRPCGQPASGSPAKSTGPSTAGTWTSSPATICPTLPRTLPWRRWPTWAVPGGALKRSSRRRRATWDWTSTDPHLGWVASPCGPVPAGWSLSPESAAGLGGKRCPGSPGPKSTGWCGKCCPGNGSGRMSCCGGWRRRKNATNGPDAPMPSAEPPFVHPRTFLLVV